MACVVPPCGTSDQLTENTQCPHYVTGRTEIIQLEVGGFQFHSCQLIIKYLVHLPQGEGLSIAFGHEISNGGFYPRDRCL